MSDQIQIGAWSFSPSAAELRRGSQRQALEDRAARLLNVLARERGKVVSHEQLIAEIWNNRTVSANSVAVVVGDLRRALGDDARAPRYIETVAKRGYRLRELGSARRLKRPPALAAAAVAAAALLAVGGGLLAPRLEPISVTPVVIEPVSNETGDPRYAPLARAVGALVLRDATESDVLRVGVEPRASSVIVSGRLVLWNGRPSVSLSAVDTSSGEVVWSGIAPGPADSLPRQVRQRMRECADALAARTAG